MKPERAPYNPLYFFKAELIPGDGKLFGSVRNYLTVVLPDLRPANPLYRGKRLITEDRTSQTEASEWALVHP